MITAWVLPGGASMGAIQAGQAAALMDAGMAPDVVIGTSAGALNAAWLAADPTARGAESLGRLWLGVRRREVFPLRPATLALGALGRRDHLVPSGALRRWLEAQLPYRRLEEARIPLTVTATDLDTGTAVHLSAGPAVESLLASCAIPGIFAPVVLAGRTLVDGGLSVDRSVELAALAGAERVVVLPTLGAAGGLRPTGAGGVLLRSVNTLFASLRDAAMAPWASSLEVYVAPVPATGSVSPFSFRHGERLMAEARGLTGAWAPTARPLRSTALVD